MSNPGGAGGLPFQTTVYARELAVCAGCWLMMTIEETWAHLGCGKRYCIGCAKRHDWYCEGPDEPGCDL